MLRITVAAFSVILLTACSGEKADTATPAADSVAAASTMAPTAPQDIVETAVAAGNFTTPENYKGLEAAARSAGLL